MYKFEKSEKKILKIPLYILYLIFALSCKTTKLVYEVAETFEIPLELNGQGGYIWQYVPRDGIVIIDSSETSMQGENKLWEYTKIYKLKGAKRGKYEIEFLKKRVFAADGIPSGKIKKYKVKIE